MSSSTRSSARKRSVEPIPPRKELIAEMVITLLAEEGSRGMTHRTIDRRLGLPEGSTSFYYRRRTDLFEAGFRKMIEMDVVDTSRCFAPVIARLAAGEPIDVALAAACQYDAWQEAMLPKSRNRALARFEFFLESARDDERRKSQGQILKDLFSFGVAMFAALGAKHPNWAGLQYGNLWRADIMAYFLVPSSVEGFKATREYYAIRFESIIKEANLLSEDIPDAGGSFLNPTLSSRAIP